MALNPVTTGYYNTFKQKILKGDFNSNFPPVSIILMSGPTVSWAVATLSTLSQIAAHTIANSELLMGFNTTLTVGSVTTIKVDLRYILTLTGAQPPITGIVMLSDPDLIAYYTFTATPWSEVVYIPTANVLSIVNMSIV